MKLISCLLLFLFTLCAALAAGPDDLYVEIYNLIQQADGMNSSQARAAAEKYSQAQAGLKKLQANYPTWNDEVVKFRLNYVAEKLQALSGLVPAADKPAPKKKASLSELENQITAQQEEVRTLSADKSELEKKLKEALSAQPAAISPRELEKAVEKIVELQKEKDLLSVALEQEKAAKAAIESSGNSVREKNSKALDAATKSLKDLRKVRDDLQKKLTASTHALAALKTRGDEALVSSQNEVNQLKSAQSELDKKLAAAATELASSQAEVVQFKLAKSEAERKLATTTTDLATLKSAQDQQLQDHQPDAAKIKQLEMERDELQKKVSSKFNDIVSAESQKHAEVRAAQTEVNQLKEKNQALQKKLDEANAKVIAGASSHAVETPVREKGTPEIPQLLRERDVLKIQLATTTKELADFEAHHDEDLLATQAEVKRLKKIERERDELAIKLKSTTDDLVVLKSSGVSESKSGDESKRTEQAKKERDDLKMQLAENARAQAEAQSQHEQKLLAAQTELKRLKKIENERDDLAKKIDALSKKKSAKSGDLEKQFALQARIDALEAKAVPYSAEELALLKKSEPTTAVAPAAPEKTSAEPKRGIRSIKDLPPGAGALVAEAQRAFLARDYEKAEKKYLEVLSQDDKNVYVLANLSAAQFAAGHLEDCEKNVHTALTIDAEDPACLYLLGNLRLGQNKLDEALDALSRSAKISPSNAVTQNSLGSVLSQKGLRQPAETAFRKALQMDPDYADAHRNLAFVYATQKPPFLELARWHYRKALDLGHPKDSDLENLFPDGK